MSTHEEKFGERSWFSRSIDFPSLIVACLWGLLMLFLWPHKVAETKLQSPLRYQSMVVATDEVLPKSKIYLRPDLISLPSAVSFKPAPPSNLVVVAIADKLNKSPDILEREAENIKSTPVHRVALAADAIMAISDSGMFQVLQTNAFCRQTTHDWDGVLVEVTGNRGNAISVDWPPPIYRKLFSTNTMWTARITLSFDKKGVPHNIFVEKSSGETVRDLELVRTFSHPQIWKNVVEGTVVVDICFTPQKKRLAKVTRTVLCSALFAACAMQSNH